MIDIYLITNNITKKQYVGKTQVGYLKRFNRHCRAYKLGCRNYISCAINKYGKENFSVELIKQVDDDCWEYWENYYIKYYKTHMSEGGYNMTWGGDSNPMDIPEIREKQKLACNTPAAKERYSKQAIEYNKSDKAKEVRKLLNEKYRNDSEYIWKSTKGFREYNESRKIRVGIVQNDLVLIEFDSLTEAAKYACETHNYTYGKSLTAHIKRYADKFNKNGKRAKFLGYSWTIL